MNSDKYNLIFRVKQNNALLFEENYVIVNDFIEKRIEYFFPQTSVVFEPDEVNGAQTDTVCITLPNINPLFDPELIQAMIDVVVKGEQLRIRARGAVPGTAPDSVEVWNCTVDDETQIEWHTQEIHNTQLNLYKLKRQKHFLSFLKSEPNLHCFDIAALIDLFRSERGVDLFLRFDQDVSLHEYDACPYCNCEDIAPKTNKSSHTLNGFLPSDVPLYYQCGQCSLVFMKKVFPKSELHKLYNDYLSEIELHKIDGKIVHTIDGRHMFKVALDKVKSCLPSRPSVVDMGCGSGEFLLYAKEALLESEVIGLDYHIDQDKQEYLTQANIKTVKGNLVENLSSIKKADVITTWEVIEHVYVDELNMLFDTVHDSLNSKGYFIFSTPDYDNPICRLWDFWSACPIQHLTVLSESWLDKFLENFNFELVEKFHGNAMLCDRSWSPYCVDTAPNDSERLYAGIINTMLQNNSSREHFLDALEENDLGSEIIYILRKRT